MSQIEDADKVNEGVSIQNDMEELKANSFAWCKRRWLEKLKWTGMLEPRVWILFCYPYELLDDWDKEGPNQTVSNENEEEGKMPRVLLSKYWPILVVEDKDNKKPLINMWKRKINQL